MGLDIGETTVSLGRTPDGRRLVVRRQVDAPVEAVWNVLTDTQQWPAWGPSISAVESADRRIERGTTGRVRVLDAVWLPFEITSCADHRWTWDVARIDATGHFVSASPAGAVVGFELSPLATAYAPVCARACAKIGAIASER